jgi:predicted branched-subunit amino acid permease
VLNDQSDQIPAEWMTAHFIKGMRDALRFPAWVVAASLVGVGPLAQSAGYSIDMAIASTLFVWAGPAQVLFFSGISAGMALPALAFVIGLSSMRFLPMTMALMPLLPMKDHSLPVQLTIGHMASVTVWAESLRRLPAIPEAQRVAYYLGFGAGCIGLSMISTGLGFMLSSAVPQAFGAGLLFLTPVFFTCSIAAGARNAADWLAIASGLFLEPVLSAWMGPEFDLLVLGLVGGTAAYLLKRRLKPHQGLFSS